MTTSLAALPRDDARAEARRAFLAAAGWGDANAQLLPADASPRRYVRLRKGPRAALLMDAAPDPAARPCPPDADEAERNALGYIAQARLAGTEVIAFAALSEALVQRGFSAPRVLAGEAAQGFLIVEDFGDGLYGRLLPHAEDEAALYATAVDALAALYRSTFEPKIHWKGEAWTVLDYDPLAYITEANLFLDWYVARRAGVEVSAQARADWEGLWRDLLVQTERAHAPGLTLRDYHAENLIWLAERDEAERVGLLDFQDALFAHPAYDLVSLLEDLRRDVRADLITPLKDRFFKGAGLDGRDDFEAAYAVLGAQRNAKILGFCVRAAERDGKPKYLPLLPRGAAHFAGDLAHPALKDIRAWVLAHAPRALSETP